MKKLFLSVLVVVAMCASSTVIAQKVAQKEGASAKAKTECCTSKTAADKKSCCSADTKATADKKTCCSSGKAATADTKSAGKKK